MAIVLTSESFKSLTTIPTTSYDQILSQTERYGMATPTYDIEIGHVATPTTKISMAIARPGTASPYRHCYDHATRHRSVSYDHGTTSSRFYYDQATAIR